MQPYFFPYIGYYQLAKEVDTFVFYDDVNYIKGGWINRNRILANGAPIYYGVQLQGVSQNKLINEVKVQENQKQLNKLFKTLEYNYKDAPYFNNTLELVQQTLSKKYESVAELAASSIINVANYLDIDTKFYFSSELDFGHDAGKSCPKAYRYYKGIRSQNLYQP